MRATKDLQNYGQGQAPTIFPELRMKTALTSSGSGLIVWKNPFLTAACVDVKFTDTSPEAFTLLLRKNTGVSVGPLSTLQIPLGFMPLTLEVYEAELTVSGVFEKYGRLTWRYPVYGAAEVESQGTIHRVKCKAKIEVVEEFRAPLEGIGEATGYDDFTHEVIIPEEHRYRE